MRHVVISILRLVVGSVFIYAGVMKALDPAGFLADIDGYTILPYRLAWFAAHELPWLEIVCGLAVITGLGRYGALPILLGLMFVFIAALIAAWIRGLDITCGCFGGADKGRYTLWLTRDMALLVAIVVLQSMWEPQPPHSTPSPQPES